MPKQLNNGRVTQALQRAFGFKGRYIPMLDEVIVPVYAIEDPAPADPSRLCSGTFAALSSAIPDILPEVQLFNPLGSGVICNVTNVVALGSTKFDISVRFEDDPFIVTTPSFFRDRRLAGGPACIIGNRETEIVGTGDTTAVLQVDGALTQSASWESGANDPRQPLTVLAPGRGLKLQMRLFVDAAELRVNWRWLEIPITEQNPAGGLP